MTQEQKAKRYDEAIEIIKSKWHYKNQSCFIDFAKIFPELVESEDERIKKAMIDFFKHEREEGVTVLHYGVNIERMIAWLEKQGEKDSQITLPQFTFDDILALQCCMETVKKVQEDKDLYKKLEDLHSRVYDAYHLENQGKQKASYTTLIETGNGGINALVTKELPTNSCDDEKKPTDEVEPKFHKGEWVTIKE